MDVAQYWNAAAADGCRLHIGFARGILEEVGDGAAEGRGNLAKNFIAIALLAALQA
ncbi:hypothetical protein D9M70_619680 [compost metagenome]